MSQESNEEKLTGPAALHFSINGDPAFAESEEDLAAWTEIEDGRFMPRRIRGSCQGRALG